MLPRMTLLRRAESEEDREALRQVLGRSFAIEPERWKSWMERIGPETLRVIRHGPRIVGGLGSYRIGQHWGGRVVPFAGFAGVGVSPEARGLGLARRMMQAALADVAAEGFPIAGLYASTATLYRAVGFEQAGAAIRWSAPVASFGGGDHALACDLASEDEHPRLAQLYEARARTTNGHLVRNEGLWARLRHPHPSAVDTYRFGPASEPEGYAMISQREGEGLSIELSLRDVVLASRAAARRFLALVEDLRSLGNEARWLGPASDPIVSLLPEESAKVREHHRWMLRIVDVAAALKARGYAASVRGSATFAIRDATLPSNERTYRLTVEGGTAEVEVGIPASVTLDVRALAALWSGFTPPETLRVMGLLEGDPDDAHRLAALFAGPEPWLPDWF